MRAQDGPGARGRPGQRADDEPRVDGVVVGHVEREPHGRGERGLGAARARGQQPLGAQPEAGAQRELAVERLGLVAVAGDEQRAVLAEVDPDAARGLELGGEGGPRPGALEPEAQERLLARVGLQTGASIPADTCDVPWPSSPRSSTQTARPRAAARQATARPMRPPPTTATSNR